MPAAIKKVAPHKGMLDSSDMRSSFRAPPVLSCKKVTSHLVQVLSLLAVLHCQL